MSGERRLAVLVLPAPVAALPRAAELERILRAPEAVAVEPARVSPGALARLPAAVGATLAGMQARRMRLPGAPALVAVLGAVGYPLGRALAVRHPAAELWYVQLGGEGGDLHELAAARAERVYGPADPWPADLAERVAELGSDPRGG